MFEFSVPSPPFFSSTLVNWFSEFGPENLQLILLLTAAVWLAFRLAAEYAFWVLGLEDIKQAVRMILGLRLPFFHRSIVLQDGVEKNFTIPPARALFGGKITLHLDAQKGYAAVLEQTASQVRIYGPQDVYPASPEGSLRLRQVVELRDQRLEVSAAATTKDGVPVVVTEAGFICRLDGVTLEERHNSYLACSRQRVQQLVYQHWIGHDWENPAKRRKALRDLVSTALQDFIAHHTFLEVLADSPGLSSVISDIRVNPSLLEQFALDFSENSSQHGLQLTWTGQGDWRLPQDFEPQVLTAEFRDIYIDWMRSQREIQVHTGIEIQRHEINRLVTHILKLAGNLRQSGEQEDTIILRLAQHYYERIQSAIHLIESRGDKVPKEWDFVAEYLHQMLS